MFQLFGHAIWGDSVKLGRYLGDYDTLGHTILDESFTLGHSILGNPVTLVRAI